MASGRSERHLIAEKLGRHRSTIFRELKRNAFEDPQMPNLSVIAEDSLPKLVVCNCC
ncbi:helix-turn-helix domain-containing protein [Ensifer psoraleae]|uniref:Helix-turn-helix domain-containing protein n=1 Tax=Sinorhizobium psoraleae TaxID=520838 RepID=A0ABT4KNF5_9HYPH|nr:helix-turn-helix domain-containing protein [Sinorhizobium psoraleae]MCZ4093515.1 helix-turn-helix domain-containing protein [Sinorhizobium psoraleae]